VTELPSTPVLRVSGLAVSFGPVQVLTDVALEVPEGSFTSVLGSSGSGKTTLLRCIAGFERPGAGTIEIAGRPVDGPGLHVVPERRRLGYVPQEGALFPHLNVAANVGFGLRSRSGRRSRVPDLLELVGLAGYDRRFPHELSGGQQQRVALARALALEPALVLLDEPFSSLDAALRLSVRSDIAGVLRESGSTVVLVTHDQQEAMSLADHVAVLRGGHIAQVGTPRDLYLRPVDPEMAAFVGEANLVRATVRGSEAITPLGTLTAAPGQQEGPAVVLIRPEQISVVANTEAGMPAEVLEQSYLGHDSMLTVRPMADCGPERIRVRITGSADFPIGTRVGLAASGSAPTWAPPA
jgi:iron(III) transport system ATP-binding protein